MDMTFYEPAFGLDEFRRPLVYENWEALAKAILILLFGKPGFYPSIPQLGMRIQDTLYSSKDDLNTDYLKSELVYQFDLIESLVSSDEIKILKTHLAGDNSLALLIVLPIYRDYDANSIAIAIVPDGNGSVSYNYNLVKHTFI